MSIETSKTLGGIGAILMFIGILPFINAYGVIELVGLVLVMVALYNLGRYYNEGGIFNNALYGLITGLVGGIITVGIVLFTVLTSVTDFLHTIFPTWNGDWTTLPGLTPDPTRVTPESILPILAGLITTLLVLWIFAIISTFFARRSLNSLSTKSGVGLFSTAGLLILIGAVLIIVIGIGLILIWIGALILAIAFFQMKPQESQSAMPNQM